MEDQLQTPEESQTQNLISQPEEIFHNQQPSEVSPSNLTENPIENQPPLLEFPGYTEYQQIFPKCCCKIVFIPEIHRYFCGEWEIHFLMPSIVTILVLLSFVFFCVCSGPQYGKYVFLPIFFLLLFGFLFLFSYFKTITEGPGYFPFYWALSIKNDNSNEINYSFFDPAGIISTPEQENWARSQFRPPRSIVSHQARRIVLRPDHFCGWASVWIGKKNYKFFTLFNFYGAIYMLAYSISGIIGVINILKKDEICAESFLQSLFILIALIFLFMNCSFAYVSYHNAATGITNWESWNKVPTEKFAKSKKENLIDAYGNTSIIGWFCPFSPWKGKSVDELASEYSSYYSIDECDRRYHVQHPKRTRRKFKNHMVIQRQIHSSALAEQELNETLENVNQP